MWYGMEDGHYILWFEGSLPRTSRWSEIVGSDLASSSFKASRRKTDHFGQNFGLIIFRDQHAG